MANIGYIQMVRHCNQNCGFAAIRKRRFSTISSKFIRLSMILSSAIILA